MPSYKELVAQRAELEKQIIKARAEEFSEVVDKIKKLMADYGITPADLGLGSSAKKARQRRRVIKPKYRDPQTGAEWSGRGKPPKWIAGQDRSLFVIQDL